mgnify:CR=1 FL=1
MGRTPETEINYSAGMAFFEEPGSVGSQCTDAGNERVPCLRKISLPEVVYTVRMAEG